MAAILLYAWASPSHRPSVTLFEHLAYLFNGWDRGRVWDGIDGQDFQVGIDGPPLTWSGANTRAAGVSTVGTHRVRYRYFDQGTGNYSPPSNAVDVVIAGGDEEVTFSVGGVNEIQQSPDTRVDFVILEVTAITQVEFFEADRVVNDGATTPVFDLTDLVLIAGGSLPWPVQVGTIPPPLFRYGLEFRGRIFGAGQVIHTDGTVLLTSGSPVVTGTLTNWTMTGDIVGRSFSAGSVTGTEFFVQSVDSPTQITLTANYVGVTTPGVAYRIFTKDDQVFWSEANYPEVFDPANAIGALQRVTALNYFGADVLIFGSSSLDRLSYNNTPSDGLRRQVPGDRGAYGQLAVIQVENVVYAMDLKGIYVYQGGTPVHISRQIDGDLLVNQSFADKVFAVYYPIPRIIRWFFVGTAPGDGTEPTRYAEWNMDDKVWGLGQLDVPMTAGVVPHKSTYLQQQYLGDANGFVWVDDAGSSAGGAPTSPARLNVIAGATSTFVPLAPNQLGVFDTLYGVMVRTPLNYTAVVDTNDASSLTLLAPGFTTPPADGDQLLVGRIVSRLKLRACYMDDTWKTRKRGVYLWLHFQPQSHGEFRVRFYRNLSPSPVKDYPAIGAAAGRLEEEGVVAPSQNGSDFVVALTKDDGVVKVPIGTDPWRVIQVELEVIEPQSTLVLYGWELTSAEGRETRA